MIRKKIIIIKKKKESQMTRNPAKRSVAPLLFHIIRLPALPALAPPLPSFPVTLLRVDTASCQINAPAQSVRVKTSRDEAI